MYRNRFEEITKFLRFSNNEKLGGRDQMSKIRPLLDLLNNKFIANAPDCNDIYVDVAMITLFRLASRLGLWYRGRDIALLQTYIKGKIVRGLVTKALESQ
ncbi:hypothetical protein PR048_015338 [Dryococelus australis]|uniref:PiggyBac transposable element-derived protein domain-containing protein n=1 Tax=Dryococelus australis TaxID=614101 RepID=A0ABQ9HGY1_9NEOP|nr:hypothetical protein PR048_015338 [Dryococelus australis]